MKPWTAFLVGFLACYAFAGVLTYRVLDRLAFESMPALRHSITWPSTLLATADGIQHAGQVKR